MINRQKVIKGIDICLQRFRCREDCPYYNYEKIGCMEQLREDALALLKEQEAKKVLQIRNVAYRTIGYCPSCGRGLDSYHDGNSGEHITHFCYNCGQAVKWE